MLKVTRGKEGEEFPLLMENKETGTIILAVSKGMCGYSGFCLQDPTEVDKFMNTGVWSFQDFVPYAGQLVLSNGM
jgi:hypothetical protein